MRELEGKIALVTGAGAGIGKAIALAFAKAGAFVVVPDLDIEKAGETAQEIEEIGQKSLALEIDVANAGQVDALFTESIDLFGRIDILVNNAGTTHPVTSILDLGLDYVEKIFSIDYKGVYLCCRRAGREMVRQKSGSIVNISSIAGLTPLPFVMYGPMKSAVNMLTRILAREWANQNIRVNAIAPGYVLTPLIKNMIDSGLRDPGLILEQTPMKTMLNPDDIAEAVLFLVSSRARHITGAVLPVDGGWLSDGGWAAYNL
jgi:NAD(P)-dependent dehydrogenase (short-subunit alcohol dehydrogenase family)